MFYLGLGKEGCTMLVPAEVEILCEVLGPFVELLKTIDEERLPEVLEERCEWRRQSTAHAIQKDH